MSMSILKAITEGAHSAPLQVHEAQVIMAELREAAARAITAQGCSCCADPNRDEIQNRLAKLLDIPEYQDGSGYNWYSILGMETLESLDTEVGESSPISGDAWASLS